LSTRPAPAVAAPGGVAIETDALVIGAGPAGLFQVFQLGLLGISAHVVDALHCIGGQCIELYPDKPIYDIPGIAHCTGRELVARLEAQVTPFQPAFHLGQEVAALAVQADGRFSLETSKGRHFVARCVVIAGGVGAFMPRLLKVEGIEGFRDRQVLYHAAPSQPFAKQHVVVNGGDDQALRQAIAIAEAAGADRPASVTLVHRRDGFQADATLVARMRELAAEGRLRFVVGQVTGIASGADAQTGEERLHTLHVTQPDATVLLLPVDTLLVLAGLSPRLGPIADWGIPMERRQLVVNPATCATSVPGIYAVGDINTYPGKKKLIACAFHEAIMAAYAAVEYLNPGTRVLVQYTTTSSQLHARLGVTGVR
jgi:thioredoxin reductase (NADPH)